MQGIELEQSIKSKNQKLDQTIVKSNQASDQTIVKSNQAISLLKNMIDSFNNNSINGQDKDKTIEGIIGLIVKVNNPNNSFPNDSFRNNQTFVGLKLLQIKYHDEISLSIMTTPELQQIFKLLKYSNNKLLEENKKIDTNQEKKISVMDEINASIKKSEEEREFFERLIEEFNADNNHSTENPEISKELIKKILELQETNTDLMSKKHEISIKHMNIEKLKKSINLIMHGTNQVAENKKIGRNPESTTEDLKKEIISIKEHSVKSETERLEKEIKNLILGYQETINKSFNIQEISTSINQISTLDYRLFFDKDKYLESSYYHQIMKSAETAGIKSAILEITDDFLNQIEKLKEKSFHNILDLDSKVKMSMNILKKYKQ